MKTILRFADSPRNANPSIRIQLILCGIMLACLPGCSGCDTPSTAHKREANATAHSPQHARESNTAARSTPDSKTGSQESPSRSPTSPITAKAGSAGETNGATERQASSSPPTAPAAALQQARELHRTSQRLANEGDPGGAFRDASRAWQLVSRFPNDPACLEMAGQLVSEMEALGERANRNFDAEQTSQPLMLQ